jgi:hypothetical protein
LIDEDLEEPTQNLEYQMAKEEALMVPSQGQDFMSAFAQQFAEK